MNYQETVELLFARLPMFTRIGGAAYKANLDNISALLDALHHPEKDQKFVHVGGTNGKGSTSHLLASTLAESGYKVGLFTSPHIYDFRERIKINGKCISEKFVIEFTEKCIPFFDTITPSFFELTTAMAFSYFQQEKTDIAIIEVGMGGRLDSTNIIIPECSVITYIGKDHEQFLGDTLPKIAAEKAGIIKSEIPVVIGRYQEELENIFRDKAIQENTHLYYADKIFELIKLNGKYILHNRANSKSVSFIPALTGSYQADNYKAAAMACEILKDRGWQVNDEDLQKGFENVVSNTAIAGRFEYLLQQPKIIADVAHNIDGITAVLKQIHTFSFDQLHIILGFVSDKDIDAILSILPKTAHYIATQAQIPRALPYLDLQQKLLEQQLLANAAATINDAILQVATKVKPKDIVLIIGSFFILSELDRKTLENFSKNNS